MAAKILDGKALAGEIQAEIAAGVEQLQHRTGVQPGLATVLVGADPASQVYVRNKRRACERAGMLNLHIELPADASQHSLLSRINELNHDPRVHGILVQLPLPDHMDPALVLDAVDPAKDVDCFHPQNVGRLSQGRPRFLPCTPHGVVQLLARNDLPAAGRHTVIVGRSDIVGKPLALMLLQKDSPAGGDAANSTVTVCHSRTANLTEITRQADILVAAIGRAGFITADMVRPNAVVVDVGINRVDGKLVGDVAYDEVAAVASAISPVPGGVGPLTVTMLLENTLRAAQSPT